MFLQRLRVPLVRVVDSSRRPELILRVRHVGSLTEIELTGVVDLVTADLLTEAVDHVVAAYAPRRLVLDLAGVRLLCAAGITALLHARETVKAGSGRLTLRNPSPMVRKVLAITDTARCFTVVTGASRRTSRGRFQARRAWPGLTD
jgi:anti-anti-sigma factor